MITSSYFIDIAMMKRLPMKAEQANNPVATVPSLSPPKLRHQKNAVTYLLR